MTEDPAKDKVSVMKRVWISLWVVANLAFVFLACAEEPATAFQNSRYKSGMTIEEAQNLMSKKYVPATTGQLVDDENPAPTGKDAEDEVRYVLRVDDEAVHLYFNWNRRLIGIRDLTKKENRALPPKAIAGEGRHKEVKDAVLFFLENTPRDLLRPWILASKETVQRKVVFYDAEKRIYHCDAWEVNLAKRTATIKNETEMLDATIVEVDGVLKITDIKFWKIIPRPESLK